MEFERKRYTNNHVNIAPLVDVIFLLLLFFMLTSNLVQEPTIKVRLPKSKTAESTRNDIKTIYITKDGSIFFMDKKIELKDISRVVKGVLNDQEIEFIRIKADKEADVGVLVSVIDEVRLTGVKNYSIVTEKKGE